MNGDQASAAEERNARVLAKATFLQAAYSTGDVDTMRAAALTVHRTEKTDQKEDPR